MRISKLTIKGFRSFDSEGIEFSLVNNISAFIGQNSSGKSTTLEAIRKLFGTTSNERELIREDFHVAPGSDINSTRNLSIEAILDFADSDEDAVSHFFSHMVVEREKGSLYLRLRLEATWTSTDYLESGNIESNLFFIKVAIGEAESAENKLNFPAHLKGLIQVIYIPAIRNPTEQLRYSVGSLFYRVLRKIQWDEDFKEDFEEKISGINSLFDSQHEFSAVSKSISEFWKKFHTDKRYKEAKLSFANSDYESVLKRMEISFDPTGLHRPYRINDLGEGYRSLFYITLVCALLDIEDQLSTKDDEIEKISPLLTVLALEEPENHIAPQLLGRVLNNLHSIANRKSQILISSHTPAMISRIDPLSIFHFRIDPTLYRTKVNTIRLPTGEAAHKYVKEAVRNYPEIYFSSLVVIGEGDSEEILFKRISTVHNVNFDDHAITFVPLGHRFVNHIWKLLNDLEIPFVTLLDLDLGREGGGFGRIKYALKQLIRIGTKKENLLLTDNGLLTDGEFEDMHTWAVGEGKSLQSWITFLREYNVFFSEPLDLDFLMLENYPYFYKATIPDTGGPRIPDKEFDPDAFDAKVSVAVSATLKSENADDSFYSEDQKEKMIYYNYLFLGRGKPTTHIQALSKMTDEEIELSLPEVFVKIFKRIKKILVADHEED